MYRSILCTCSLRKGNTYFEVMQCMCDMNDNNKKKKKKKKKKKNFILKG